jgi:hypothetical protein
MNQRIMVIINQIKGIHQESTNDRGEDTSDMKLYINMLDFNGQYHSHMG